MPAHDRRLILLGLAALAVVVGIALGYQPSGIGIHPAPSSTTASTRVPLGLRQGPHVSARLRPPPGREPPDQGARLRPPAGG